MDYLRQGIHLRGYAQKNPKQEYKRESFELFAQMLDKLNYEVISILSKFEVQAEEDVEAVETQQKKSLGTNVRYQHAQVDTLNSNEALITEAERDKNVIPFPSAQKPFTREERKIGRNESCPCGSGKKYKHCHGSLS